MFKRIFAIVFLVLILAGIAFYLINFRKSKRPISSAIRAVPASASFIIDTRQTHPLWKKLSETNMMWEELLNIKFIHGLNEQVKFFDSIYLANSSVKEIFDQQPMLISAHATGEHSFSFLFLFSILPIVNAEEVANISNDIANAFPGYSRNEKQYDEAVISMFSSPQKTFSFSVYNDIFIGSFNTMLTEDAIRQINSGSSLSDDFSFHRAAATAGQKSDAIFYINYKKFPGILSQFAKKNFTGSVEMLSSFSDWSVLDLKLKPNILMLNGFSYSNDTMNRYLNFFEGQKPQEAEFTRVIPYNTASFVHWGFSNFSGFYKQYRLHREKNTREEKIIQINRECGCDMQKNLLSWIENEMSVLVTESSTGSLADNFFAVFKSNNMNEAQKELHGISDSFPENALPGFTIRKLKIPGLHSVLLGELFSPLTADYFSTIGEYVVFANSPESLRNFILNYTSGKTLYTNLNFHSFAENLSSESNIFVYTNMGRSANIFKQFLNEEYSASMEENKELFGKFEALAMQFSAENKNLFYNNIVLKYNPAHKQEITTFWEARLDTTVSSKPHLVVNHYTQAKEIFAQDDANTIYLISNKGKILWKKPLPEKIISGMFQIDALKNNKLQMLFNTASSIYLLDRNGKDVSGFPVKLKTEATTEISVFDYEQNKNYRMLVACADGNMYNFEKTGQPVKGWEFPKFQATVKQPVQHFISEGKDYLVAIDEAGTIYITDRSGKNRKNMNGKIHLSKNNSFYIETGKDIGKTRIVATDSTGNIVRLYFNGNMENIKINDFSERHFFACRDINNDKTSEYIFADKNKFWVYTQDILRYSLFDYTFDANISAPPQFFQFPDNSVKIGIADTESNKIYLYSENGIIHENFPLFGNTPFSIGNINNDSEIYLITGNGSNIYAYLLK